MIPFIKYHGTGNDFILIDDRKTLLELKTETIRKICDRHFGIGADGLIQLRNKNGFDFEMLYFNADGLPGSMCGNGGRCVTAFAHSLGMILNHAKFIAFDGVHEAKITSLQPFIVNLQMNDVRDIESTNEFILMNTGSPHYVCFIDDVNVIDVLNEGKKIRYNERFKNAGVNVNFVMEKDRALYVRTYERGVEDETLSCGTGVTASVLAAAFSGKKISTGCMVQTPGGKLNVHFKQNGNNFSNIWLEGEVVKVFSGVIPAIE